MTDPTPDARAAIPADGQVWRDSLGRTWVAVGPPAEERSDRIIREVASGTRRGAIEWATGQDDSARGLFAARRALLESLSSSPNSAAAVPRVEGVLVSGDAIVVENPGGDLETWWIEAADDWDRVARWIELLAGVSRNAGRLVEAAAAEGLVPVVRPRSLRAQESGKWLVTEFAPLADRPPELGSEDVLGGYVAPEAVQGLPSTRGGASVVWGVGSTLLSTIAWANMSVDGSTGDMIESPAGQTQLGRLLSDLHTRGVFDGGPDGLRAAFRNHPHPDHLPGPDRDAVLRFADHMGMGREVGASIVDLLDEALTIDPSLRPSPFALAERLERLARDVRSAVRPRNAPAQAGGAASVPLADSPADSSAVVEAVSKRKARSATRRKEPSTDRVIRDLRDVVASLQAKLEASEAALGELRTEHESLARTVAAHPRPPSYALVHSVLLLGILTALSVAAGGWYHPEAPPPERVIIEVEKEPGPAPLAEPQAVAELVDPDTLGIVKMEGGTILLEGDRGVFSAGPTPPGMYRVRAQPMRGPNQDLGEVTVYAGEILSFRCAGGVCARVPK